ncbi:MFS transporter [Nocardioides sp. KIGAM211]|uniref:MFS transporter n=1 Tax=Nocardioides luti TaxID=2761101 RepID=A0A7X0RJQ8_9ACTN|nr:MFS transporter [Nocardioides luti]MBB6629586.1 MFS transporter [Nocardioides luti]
MTRSSERRLGLLLLAAAAGTNIPTPLLLVYRAELDMSSTSVTALFGVYALGLMPAVALAGPAADRWGRRRVAIPVTLFSALTSLLYVTVAHHEPLLFLVRFLQGAGAGAVFTVGSAWLVEAAVREGSRSGPRTAAVAMTGGFAIGPAIAGLIGQWGPWPLILPYLLHVVALLLALAAAWTVTETLVPRAVDVHDVVSRSPFLPGRLSAAVLVVAPLAVCVYAFPASAIAGVPVLIGLPAAPVALTGLLAGATLGAGSLAAPLQGRLGARTAPVAAACGFVGFALTAVAAAVPALLLLAVPAAVVLGAGGGLSLASGLARLPTVAAEGRLGTVSAAFYATAYVGFGVPLLLAALASVADVSVWLGVLAVTCGVLAVQQARARL